MAATGDAPESDDADTETETIQTHAGNCLRHMLGQPARRLGVQDLDDLSLPQRDIDRMKARITPKGRGASSSSGYVASGRGSAPATRLCISRTKPLGVLPSEGRVQRKRTKAKEATRPGALDAYNGAEFMVSPSGTNSNFECPLLLAQQLDGADDAAPEDENGQTSAHIRYPGADARLFPGDTGRVARAAALQLYMSAIKAISICFYGDDSSTGTGRFSKPSDSTKIWRMVRPHGRCTARGPHVWFLKATALYNRAFDMCGYLAILYSRIRRAGTILDRSDDGDVDWFHEYKQVATIAELPNRPPYKLLQPKAFLSLFRLGHLASRDAYWALQVIMRMICLRRDMGDPVDCDDNRGVDRRRHPADGTSVPTCHADV
ncbi:hypothetical protein IFM61392_08309 [Aspergillus lentulus]|nr:hypothetical protein CNMCM6069_003460 [Aspergillus lentulus]GFG14165.1 hypothetical protein IFM61392_08309 [Aspergillus lentulus]